MQKPHTGIPTHAPTRYPKTGLQNAPPSHRHPPHPSFTPFLLSAFLLFSRCHFPCSWQADINRAASKTFNEKQTPWHSPSHTGIPTHAPTRYPKTGLQNAPHSQTSPHLLASSTLPASNAPLSKGTTFLNPWQTDTNTAISKTFRIEQVPHKKGQHSTKPFTM